MTLFDLFNINPEEAKAKTSENKPLFSLSPEEAQQRFQEITKRMFEKAERNRSKKDADQNTTAE